MAKILGIHRWDWSEDLLVCIYAVDRKTDPKSINKLSRVLGIKAEKVAFRMSNYVKMATGKTADWHISRQEKKVFNVVSALHTLITIKVK